MQIIPDRDLCKADLIAGCPSKGQWYGKCKAVMCINRTIYFVALLIRIKRRGDGIVECTVRKWQISRIFQNERNRDLITAVSEQEGSCDLQLQMEDCILRCQIRSRWQQKGAASGETERSVSDKRLPAGSRSDIKKKNPAAESILRSMADSFHISGQGKAVGYGQFLTPATGHLRQKVLLRALFVFRITRWLQTLKKTAWISSGTR